MDNTQNENRILKPYYVQDAQFDYTLRNLIFRECDVILQVNNIFDKKYAPNGYTYPYVYSGELINDNYYYPMAGTNFMLGLNLKF
jgi:iron complex outermembrane receptor protein